MGVKRCVYFTDALAALHSHLLTTSSCSGRLSIARTPPPSSSLTRFRLFCLLTVAGSTLPTFRLQHSFGQGIRRPSAHTHTETHTQWLRARDVGKGSALPTSRALTARAHLPYRLNSRSRSLSRARFVCGLVKG